MSISFHFNFPQLPLLEIDGLRLVQTQATLRYLARRANLNGMSTTEEVTCDMYAEAVCDMLDMLKKAPWTRLKKEETTIKEEDSIENPRNNEMSNEAQEHIIATRKKWHAMLGPRLEQRLVENYGRMQKELNSSYHMDNNEGKEQLTFQPCLVGQNLTYADILVAHLVTWLIEEIGCSCVENYPHILRLQQRVVKLPGIMNFLGSNLYYSVGDEKYCKEVDLSLAR